MIHKYYTKTKDWAMIHKYYTKTKDRAKYHKNTNNDLQNTTHTQTMIYKTLHIYKNTNNDTQNTTHIQKHK